jgi:hypothetical protein
VSVGFAGAYVPWLEVEGAEEEPCDMHDLYGWKCPNEAVWVCSTLYSCMCEGGMRDAYACDPCLGMMHAQGWFKPGNLVCKHCDTECEIVYTRKKGSA